MSAVGWKRCSSRLFSGKQGRLIFYSNIVGLRSSTQRGFFDYDNDNRFADNDNDL